MTTGAAHPTMMMLDAALESARRVPVFPVWNVTGDRCGCGKCPCGDGNRDAGKHPLGALVPHGVKDATTDEATIRKWWTRYMTANIATPTSWASVLDVDPRNGGDDALARLEQQHGPLPETAEVLTGGGGRHIYFQPVPGLAPSAGKVGPGLDIKSGPGAYVLLPPSRHVSGGMYADEVLHPLFETLLAPMPAWLLALATAPANPANGDGEPGEATDWAALLAGAPEGQRHAVAARIAGHFLGKKLSPAEAEQILIGFSARCTPPFPADEVRRIARDLAAKDAQRAASAEVPGDLAGAALWPELAAEALYGLPGRIVEAIDSYTEADPVATLAHVLVATGNAIGPGPHARVQADLHPCRHYVALVGATSKGRKGMAWSTPRDMLARVDDAWARARVRTGLSSGEGLISHVRDAREEQQPIKERGRVIGYERVVVDEGEPDKRLLVIEPELASVLKRMGGETNTLSAILRQAYDSGTLSTLTKNSPLRATGAHVSLVGHVTREELVAQLTELDRANGFANRFIFLLVRRSKVLPEGAAVPERTLAPLVEELRETIRVARDVGEVRRDDEAREMWNAVYPTLSEGKAGLVGAIVSRAEAHVLRLSVTYAVLDRSRVVRRPHLEAALGLWDYAEASARIIFGGLLGLPLADQILQALRARGPMTRSEIGDLFGRNLPSAKLDTALVELQGKGLVRSRIEPTAGRSRTVWEATG